MAAEDFLYRVGELVERIARSTAESAITIILPKPGKSAPDMRFLRKVVRKELSIHELLSLQIQLVFLGYLLLSLIVVLAGSLVWFIGISAVYFIYLRYMLVRNGEFFIDPRPYKVFYYGLSGIALASYAGYFVLRIYSPGMYYFYGYLVGIFTAVMLFRHVFRSRYGRDYTYGVVEEVKNDMVRVFIHDDIAANMKPGRYWLPAVPDAEPGRVVKILIEDRPFRSAKPLRILEVYLEDLDQSSQTEAEPKEDAE